MNEKKQVPIINKATGDVTVGHQTLKLQRESTGFSAQDAAPTLGGIEGTRDVADEPRANPFKTGGSENDPKVKKGRPSIDSIAAIIEFGYSRKGQRISLKRSELKKISVASTLTDEDRRRLHELSTNDRHLAVPRQLLLFSRDLLELPRIRNEVREFVRDVLRNHPVFASNDLEPVIQNLEGAPSIRDAFARIADTELSNLNAGVGEKAYKAGDLEDLKRNAVGSLAVWAVDMRGVSVAELTSALFEGYWASRSQEVRSEADVLRAITDIHETVGAGLICGELNKRVEDSARSANAANRAASTAAAQLQGVMKDLEVARATISELEVRLDALMRAGEEERNASRITQNHLRGDFESLRTRVLRRLNEDVRLLGDGLVALSRVPPKVEIMMDHAERVMDSLKNEIKKLGSGE